MLARPLTSPQVLVGGRWLSSMLMWGDLKITDRWPYGCWEAQWSVLVKPYQRVPDITADAPVEIRTWSGLRWAGRLARPDWESGTMLAYGLARQGETTLCLNSSGGTTSIPNTAVDEAIARSAVNWTRPASLSSSAAGEAGATRNLNYLTALLDAWALSADRRWGVNARGEVFSAADPTAPALCLRPGVGELGVSNQSQAARVFGRFKDTDGLWKTVSVGSGRPEVGVSLARRGRISSTQATNIITGIRNQAQPSTGWTNRLLVTADMVTTLGGQRFGLDRVNASEVLMARLLGLRDERGASATTDIVIAETEWDVNAGEVAVTPVGLDDQSLAGAVEAAGGELLS